MTPTSSGVVNRYQGFAMVTINVGAETTKLKLPTTWKEVADSLGISPQQLDKHREALELKNAPITSEVCETLRRSTEFCKRRNTGGGGSCTRQEFVRLTLSGQLEERLKALNII